MALEHESDSAIARAVRAAGSQSALARLLTTTDRTVRQSTVNNWLKLGRVHHDQAIAVENATGISRHDLRPDIYPREDAPGAAAAAMEPAR